MSGEKYIWPQPEDSYDGELSILTTEQLCEQADQEKALFFENLKYWKYDPDNQTLTHIAGDYEVDLERFPSKAEYLEWIMHLHGKMWMTVDAFVELVMALQYLINHHDLPAEVKV